MLASLFHCVCTFDCIYRLLATQKDCTNRFNHPEVWDLSQHFALVGLQVSDKVPMNISWQLEI